MGMRTVIWFLLLFAVAVLAASTFGANDGIVSVYWAPWRIDLSLNLFVLLLLGTCLVAYAVIQAVNALVGLPRRAHEWRVLQRERAAQAALREALALSYAGRFSRAQKSAQRAIDIQARTPELKTERDFTALAHLLAAQSAHRTQDRARRDDQLRAALEQAGVSPAAEGAHLLSAEWALDDRDAERAMHELAQLPAGVARRTQALRLRLKAARLAGQPMEALRTARLLAKHQGFSPAAAQGLLRSLANEALDAARDVDQLRRIWAQLDSADRRDAFVAAHAARRAGELDSAADGRAWLRPFWERLPQLAQAERAVVTRALPEVTEGLPAEWLPVLEAAVKALPGDAAVAHAAGRALAERGLWGHARRLLEFAAGAKDVEPARRRDAWRALATLAEEEGDAHRAQECHRQAALVC
jgi:HemY protein